MSKLTINNVDKFSVERKVISYIPKLNAHISYDRESGEGEIRTIKDINVNMPWILPNEKMMTISINNIEKMSLYEINKHIKEIGEKISHMDTNALSNTFSTKINYDLLDKRINGTYQGDESDETKSKLPICLAFDHRALDFGEVIPFMKKLDSIFENPKIIKTFQ